MYRFHFVLKEVDGKSGEYKPDYWMSQIDINDEIDNDTIFEILKLQLSEFLDKINNGEVERMKL